MKKNPKLTDVAKKPAVKATVEPTVKKEYHVFLRRSGVNACAFCGQTKEAGDHL